jgi:hypothetical protein
MRALFVCCLSLAITPGSLADSPRQDSTDAVRIVDCSWWQKPIVPSTGRPPAKDVVAEATVALKGAVAKGISIGQGSNLALFLPMSAAVVDRPGVTQEGIQRLAENWFAGQLSVGKDSSVLKTGLDVKCSDYRNASVSLDVMSFLVTLEIGGLATDRTEAALQVVRRKGGHFIPPDILEALLR